MCLPSKSDQSSSDRRHPLRARDLHWRGGRDRRVAPALRAPGADDRDVVTSTTPRPKAVIQRLIDEVINAGRLELIDELYAPQLAAGARRWIAPFRESFPDVEMERVHDGQITEAWGIEDDRSRERQLGLRP